MRRNPYSVELLSSSIAHQTSLTLRKSFTFSSVKKLFHCLRHAFECATQCVLLYDSESVLNSWKLRGHDGGRTWNIEELMNKKLSAKHKWKWMKRWEKFKNKFDDLLWCLEPTKREILPLSSHLWTPYESNYKLKREVKNHSADIYRMIMLTFVWTNLIRVKKSP